MDLSRVKVEGEDIEIDIEYEKSSVCCTDVTRAKREQVDNAGSSASLLCDLDVSLPDIKEERLESAESECTATAFKSFNIDMDIEYADIKTECSRLSQKQAVSSSHTRGIANSSRTRCKTFALKDKLKSGEAQIANNKRFKNRFTDQFPPKKSTEQLGDDDVEDQQGSSTGKNDSVSSRAFTSSAQHRKLSKSSVADALIRIEKQKLEYLLKKRAEKEDDGDLCFLKSLLPFVRMLLPTQKMEYRMKVMRITRKFMESRQDLTPQSINVENGVSSSSNLTSS